MPMTTIADRVVEVNDEGFLTDPGAWDEELGAALASLIGVEMTEKHWNAVRFVRDDYATNGETPTLRRIATAGGFAMKELFDLFPKKPAKKISYVAGVPKPVGCV